MPRTKKYTDEERKAKAQAYNKAYYEKNKEKMKKQIRDSEKKRLSEGRNKERTLEQMLVDPEAVKALMERLTIQIIQPKAVIP